MSLRDDRRTRLASAVALSVLLADQATKAIVQRAVPLHQSYDVTPFAALTFVWNTGAAFGLFAGWPGAVRAGVFLVASVLAVAAFVSLLRGTSPDQPALVAALGGILGGAVGNAICRLRYGAVVDFLDLHVGDLHWPAFNVADSAITVGVVVVLWHWLRDARREQQTAPLR